MENKASHRFFKKRAPQEPPKKPDLPEKLKGARAWAAEFLKLLAGIALFPFVYSFSVSFLSEFSVVDKVLRNSFWAGFISLLALYLFVWEPQPVFTAGYKILEVIFGFFAPLVKTAPYLVPIYTIVLFVFYGLLSFTSGTNAWPDYFLFFIGASTALHLVFSAKALRSKKSGSLQAGYVFGSAFVYITNLVLLGLCLSLNFGAFSFIRFFNTAACAGRDVFSAILKQLFVM